MGRFKLIQAKDIKIRKGIIEDVPRIKELAEMERSAIGFMTRSTYKQAIENGQILVVMINDEVVGFQYYYHRKRDTQTTLYQKTIDKEFRHQGLAKLLVDAVINEALLLGHKTVLLKCPVGLESNEFHRKIGFSLIGQEQGKKRKLNIWVKEI